MIKTRLGAQRYNNRMNKIWENVRKQPYRYSVIDRSLGLFVIGPYWCGRRIEPTDCCWLVPGTADHELA